MRVLALLALLLLSSVGSAAGAGSAPALTLRDRTPLAIQGARFSPGERVVVTAVTGLGPRRAVVTALRGRFVVQFGLPAKGCGAPYAVRAVGSQGSKATLVLGEAEACVPPPIR